MPSKRIERIFEILKKLYPEVEPQLDYTNPFELLIATILSAQCTDKRVNEVTKDLFRKYQQPKDYLLVPDEELQKDIFSLGFYKQKTKSIKKCCEQLVEDFGSKVPTDFNELTKLAGVGRKTASVVAGNAFGIPAIAVDTHVKRLSNILGFTKSKNPDIIEGDLKKLLPEKEWVNSSHWLIMHGRNTCIARRPKCSECQIIEFCPAYNGELQ